MSLPEKAGAAMQKYMEINQKNPDEITADDLRELGNILNQAGSFTKEGEKTQNQIDFDNALDALSINLHTDLEALYAKEIALNPNAAEVIGQENHLQLITENNLFGKQNMSNKEALKIFKKNINLLTYAVSFVEQAKESVESDCKLMQEALNRQTESGGQFHELIKNFTVEIGKETGEGDKKIYTMSISAKLRNGKEIKDFIKIDRPFKPQKFDPEKKWAVKIYSEKIDMKDVYFYEKDFSYQEKNGADTGEYDGGGKGTGNHETYLENMKDEIETVDMTKILNEHVAQKIINDNIKQIQNLQN